MSRRPHESRHLLVIAALALSVLLLGLAGCGDDDDDGGSSAGADPALDAEAKASVRTAQTALEVYATERAGDYSGATVEALRGIESTLPEDLEVSAEPATYELTLVSETGTEFTVARDEAGVVSYTCDAPGEGGCPDSGEW